MFSLAKDVIEKIEKAEQRCEDLVEMEKEKLKLRLKDVKLKVKECFGAEKKKNADVYSKAVEEFKIRVDKKTKAYKEEVDRECAEIEANLKKNVSRAIDFIVSRFLNS